MLLVSSGNVTPLKLVGHLRGRSWHERDAFAGRPKKNVLVVPVVSSFVWMESPRSDVVLSSFSHDGAKASSSSAIRAFVRNRWCPGISNLGPRARKNAAQVFWMRT